MNSTEIQGGCSTHSRQMRREMKETWVIAIGLTLILTGMFWKAFAGSPAIRSFQVTVPAEGWIDGIESGVADHILE